MTTERWQLLATLFNATLDLPPAERASFVARSCGDDLELRAELESLLTHDADLELGSVIAKVVESAGGKPAGDSGLRLGDYELIREIGRGGMGSVYLALHTAEGFRREVAIKLVRRGMDSDFLLDRFRKERQILANLSHPNIAHVFDGGSTRDGRPYFVMEYIEGQRLVEYCRAQRLSIEARVDLFCIVCSAVQHAHRNLVVHRDLKPGNILVTKDGVPKLLDFGIAKLLAEDTPAEDLTRTLTSFRLMTLDYASPEQVRGQAITTATDVYQLGAVLFELLTERRPFRFEGLSPAEIGVAICETGVPLASSVVDYAARRKQLAGDLDNIVRTAMRTEPARRYGSVEQLAEDLRRYRQGLPVLARKDTFGYRAGKWVRRHKLAVLSAVLVAASLVGGIIATTLQARARAREAQRAQQRFDEVRKLASRFLFDFDREIVTIPGTTKAREMIVSTAQEYLGSLARESNNDPGLLNDLGTSYEKVGDTLGMPGLASLGRPKDALKSYQKALEMHRKAMELDPKNRTYARDMSRCLMRVSFVEKEVDASAGRHSLEEALRLIDPVIRSGTAEAIDFRLAANGNTYLSSIEQGDANGPDALRYGRLGVDYMRRALALQNDYRTKKDLARVIEGVGRVTVMAGQLDSAFKTMEEAREIRVKLAGENPKDFENQRGLMANYSVQAELAGGPESPNRGDRTAAMEFAKEGVKVGEELVAGDPNNVPMRRDYCYILGQMGTLEADSDPLHAAILFRRSMAIADQLPESFSPGREIARAITRRSLGAFLRRLGERKESRALLSESGEIIRKLSQAQPAPPGVPRLYSVSELALGEALMAWKDMAGADQALHEAVNVLDPQAPKARTSLPQALELSTAYQGLERWLAASGRNEEAAELRRKRRELWEGWFQAAPSPFVRNQLEMARKL